MRTYFITGGAGGIGLETARELLGRGDRVIVAARDAKRCADARTQLGDAVETIEMDAASFASIRAGAARVIELAPVLDCLVNNAGVVATKRTLDVDGHEVTWAVNVMAPFMLGELLLPALQAAPEPRVVNVGSAAHRGATLRWDDLEFAQRRYGGWRAYSQSKLALVLLTREYARRHPAIAANCVHPGAIHTQIWRGVPALFQPLLARVLPPASTGAIPVVRLAAEPALAGVSGKYFDKMNESPPSAAGQNDPDGARLYELLGAATGVAVG